MIKASQLDQNFVDLQSIRDLFTPKAILESKTLDPAEKLLPDVIGGGFDSLLIPEIRERISNLKLLPVKWHADREAYKQLDKNQLLVEVLEMVGDEEAILVPNRFPYFLPIDVNQQLLWIKDHNADYDDVCRLIAKFLRKLEICPHQAIFFERPMGCETPLVRGTFPQLRHVHFWTKR